MFFSLSKAFAKFGGFRFGAGLRITKKNAIVMLFVMMFVLMFQASWYMLVLCFWLVYAICYGFILCIKSLFKALKNLIKKRGGK